jgi:hypothetical protein
MEEWVVMLRACRPWNEMFLDDVTGEFRGVLEELLQSDDEQTPRKKAARLRDVARAHGAFRRRQGCPAPILAEEIDFAQDAIAAALMRGGAAPAAVATIQDSLVPVMRAIERATYGGYAD